MIRSVLAFIAIAILFSSCIDCIEAIGEPIADKRAEKPFVAISNDSSIDVEIHFDANEEYNHVIVHAAENLQSLITAEVDGDQLVISTTDCYSSKDPVVVEVYCSRLEAIESSGSGDIVGVDEIRSGKFTIDQSGSGDVQVEVKSSDLEVEMSGSGSLQMSGRVEYFDLESSGSGSFKGEDLKTEYAEIDSSGSGDVEVEVKTSIKVDNSGSGDIFYDGKPKDRDIKADGSGKVEQR